MNTWFECQIKHTVEDENGKSKKTEVYLVDALSFSEAEERVSEEMSSYYSNMEVAGIKKSSLKEIVGEEAEADRWYKCKVCFTTIDEVNAKEKKSNTNMLVHASDIQEALTRLKEYLKDSISDCDILAISDTPIMDLIRYTPQN
jgi:hypothetical protein